MSNDAEVLRTGLVAMQVCVPKEWTDEQVETFANSQRPTGLSHGWSVCKEGDPMLAGDPPRNPCHDEINTHVHILLTC